MKTLNILPVSKNLVRAIALFLSVNLTTARIAQAQTFAGENRLREDPTVLPALIYPAKNPQTIRVNVDMGNRRGGPVTIVIRDGKGKAKHTEVTFKNKYIRKFDLSPLGAGTYTFELSNQIGQTYARSFRIETSTPRVIALGDPSEKPFGQEVKFSSTGH